MGTHANSAAGSPWNWTSTVRARRCRGRRVGLCMRWIFMAVSGVLFVAGGGESCRRNRKRSLWRTMTSTKAVSFPDAHGQGADGPARVVRREEADERPAQGNVGRKGLDAETETRAFPRTLFLRCVNGRPSVAPSGAGPVAGRPDVLEACAGPATGNATGPLRGCGIGPFPTTYDGTNDPVGKRMGPEPGHFLPPGRLNRAAARRNRVTFFSLRPNSQRPWFCCGRRSCAGQVIQWKRVDRSRRAPTSSRRSVLVGQQHGRHRPVRLGDDPDADAPRR